MLFALIGLCLSQAPTPSGPASEAAARAAYEALAPRHQEYLARRLEAPKPVDLKRELGAMNEELKALQADYNKVVQLGSPRWAVAALVRISEAYDHYGEAIEGAPAPATLDAAQAEIYRTEMKNHAQPLHERARQLWAQAEEKARELGVKSPELEAGRAKAELRGK